MCNPPVEDINGRFQGGRVKFAGFQGEGGAQSQKLKIPGGVMIKSTGNPTSREMISSIWGRGIFLSSKPNTKCP